MSLIELKSAEQLEQHLTESTSNLVVLFFAANWSDESKLMNDVVQEIGKDQKTSKQLKFVKIEAEDFEDISIKYGIEAVPSFVFIKNKNVLSKLSGADAAELRKKITQYGQLPTQTVVQSANPEEDLNARLKNLINIAPVTLFMKGTPQEPRCGFSRQIIEILNSNDVAFGHFDILSDNEVREGLKKYSNWPTYPQLYVKGELIGGLDIVKELVQSGEFQTMVPKKSESLNERLKKLVNQSKIMLFMKGSPSEPKCGFSRQTLEILVPTGLKFGTFDILSDEDVRQGLKTYSNWPTYPQIYVDGQLIGGLDILKELKQNGELESTLNPSN